MKALSHYLGNLKGNAKICIAFHPLWSIPYAVYTFYLGLYLQQHGIGDSQLGFLMMIGNIVALVASFVSAPVVDRLGRRTTTLVFDLISSALPPAIYLFSSRFEWALVAMVATNLNRIMSIGYYLTMIEDSSEKTSAVALNLFNIITIAAGLIVPAAGVVVAKLGLIRAQNIFLGISAVSMTFLAIARHLLLKETSVGIQVKEQIKTLKMLKTGTRTSFFSNLDVYPKAFAYLRQNPESARALRTNVLFYAYYAVGTSISLYFTPYFTGYLQLSASQASIIGGVYAAGTLFALVLINPLYNRRNSARFFTIAAFISLVGFSLLVSLPAQSFGWTLPAIVFISIGFGMMRTATDANFAFETNGMIRSGLYAVSYVLSAILSIVVLYLCSILYERFPPWLFLLSGLLILGIFIDQIHRVVRTRKEQS